VKITLISPYSGLAALGLRVISANLKKAGHSVKMVFLTASRTPLLDYSEKLLDQIAALSKDSGLIGISLMSGYYYQAVTLTRALKKRLPAPVIWGGIHPTSKPADCLEHADIVCIGEGEEAIAELAACLDAGTDYQDVRNLWVKTPTGIKQNSLRPLIQDLESQPFMDFDLNGHYVFTDRDEIIPMTSAVFKERLLLEESLIPGTGAYQTLWIRGCPYKCSYCCNDIYHALYKGQKILRKRSAASIVREIREIRDRFDFISNVWFHDDSFFAMSLKDIQEFSELYKKEIRLPFCALGDPLLTTEEKLGVLVDAGLHTLGVGIQSGSEKTIALYKRLHFRPEQTVKLGERIHKFTPRLKVRYDIIVDNPYETDEDILCTINMLLQIPYPYQVQLFSLTFFPETELHKKAMQDGLIRNESVDLYKKHYHQIKPTYLNLIMRLIAMNVPKTLIRAMIHRAVLPVLNRPALGLVLFLMAKWAAAPMNLVRRMRPRH
jgi:anaerobic magnesium-protoporphyrin IX monomethyl ester cyclase